jgi:cell division protease FtsH
LNDDKQKKDENDPYNFFKFAGPREPENDDKNNKDNKKKKFPFWGIFLIGLLIFTVFDLFFMSKPNDLIDYSEFRSKVENGQITYVEIGESYLIGYGAPVDVADEKQKGYQLFQPEKKQYREEYKTAAVLMSNFIDLLDEKGVQYKFVQKQNNVFLQLLLNLLFPFGLIFLMYFIFFRKMGGGSGGMGSIFNVGASRAKVVEEGKIKTRFDDVAGVDEAKEELVEVVDFLKNPKKIYRHWWKNSKRCFACR